jgi:hypothetical protein
MSSDLLSDGPATIPENTSTDELVVLGRVPVIQTIVASERVKDRQRAEAVAREWRGSGLEVEIQDAAAQPS